MSRIFSIALLGAIPDILQKRLSERYNVVSYDDAQGDEMIEVAVTTSMTGASAEQLSCLLGLRLILCNGAGLDRIDLEEANRRGVEVFNTADAVTEDTADYAMALLFAAKRRIVEADRFVREGSWGSIPWAPSRRLGNSKVGIVGLGKIGALVAQRLRALGIEVAYHNPRPKPEVDHLYFADLESLAQWSDALILCCPAAPSTNRLVDRRILKALGTNGTLINISRGSVVAEQDLIAALETGIIAGAALDVYASEPDIDIRLLDLPNVIVSPHAAAVTYETRLDMANLLLGRADRYFSEK